MKPLKGSDWVTWAANNDSDDEEEGGESRKVTLYSSINSQRFYIKYVNTAF